MLILILSIPLYSQNGSFQSILDAGGVKWVDSVYNSLSQRERIAQLIMVAGFSNKGPEHEVEIERLVKEYGIGGIAFFQGGPVRQATLVNRYQALSKVPLLMAIDAEWGLAMRLDSTVQFPFQMALGAVRDNDLIYRMGAEIARELKEVGIQVNFAPVADVNNNPMNPVINYRSFGEDPSVVADKALAYMKGLQDNRILATGKHFPGHGDTGTDSHLALPLITHSRQRLDSVELKPFASLISGSLGGMMVAHLEVPALEPDKGVPTTVSKEVVTDLLRDSLKFNGLVMTDALNMKGLTTVLPPGEIEIKALQAGCDLLVYVTDVELALRAIESALSLGIITSGEIETRCRKILAIKWWTGVAHWKPLDINGLVDRINLPAADLINRELVAASLTVVQNREDIIPLKDLDKLDIATVSIGSQVKTTFQKRLEDYGPVATYQIDWDTPPDGFNSMIDSLCRHNLLIIGIHDMDQRAYMNFGLSESGQNFLDSISRIIPVITVVFGNPYSIGHFRNPSNFAGLVMAYQESPLTMDLASQLIFGGLGARGRLPVSVDPFFKAGDGLDTRSGLRFSYTIPEALHLDSGMLKERIDSICSLGIRERAFPGCEVLAAKDGRVFFQACYGNHVYDSIQPVEPGDLFDLASVTKVSAPLPAIMRLYQDRKIRLDVPFSRYWSDFRGTGKKSMTVRQALAHCGGLPAWIPFWRDTKNPDGTYKKHTLSPDSSSQYPIRVSAGLWRYKNYDRKIYEAIRNAPARKERKYVYSDLSFHIWPKIIARLSGKEYQEFLANEFYKPLGANTLTYNPLKKFPPDRIIPTERDTFFRMELLHGYVHDEGAALLGGVSGNAGLFGTAHDLAKLWQMYLWKGTYGGHQFLDSATVNEFTRYQYEKAGIRRGLGFDKPLVDNKTQSWEDSYPCLSASPSSFGHSGYTGTFVWADPENGLLYVFLSNRVYPTRDNNKLTDMYIRKSILQIFYDAIQHP